MPDDPTLPYIRDLLQRAQLLCGARHKFLSYLVGMALEEATDLSVNSKPHRDLQPSEAVRDIAAALVGLAHADADTS